MLHTYVVASSSSVSSSVASQCPNSLRKLKDIGPGPTSGAGLVPGPGNRQSSLTTSSAFVVVVVVVAEGSRQLTELEVDVAAEEAAARPRIIRTEKKKRALDPFCRGEEDGGGGPSDLSLSLSILIFLFTLSLPLPTTNERRLGTVLRNEDKDKDGVRRDVTSAEDERSPGT